MARRIITYSTLGDNMKEIYSNATTLGALQPDLTSNGIRFEGMKLMTNPGQVTLESLQAELPEGEFQLFIMPNKVKSGNIDEDDELVDDGVGESWNETDWTMEFENPEEHIFRSHEDLAIARAKKAFVLLEKSIQYLAGTKAGPKSQPSMPTPSVDPFINSLRAEAAKLQKNLDMFG